MGITEVEVRNLYEKYGYVTSIPILSPEELQQARDDFAELERQFGESTIYVHQWMYNKENNNYDF